MVMVKLNTPAGHRRRSIPTLWRPTVFLVRQPTRRRGLHHQIRWTAMDRSTGMVSQTVARPSILCRPRSRPRSTARSGSDGLRRWPTAGACSRPASAAALRWHPRCTTLHRRRPTGLRHVRIQARQFAVQRADRWADLRPGPRRFMEQSLKFHRASATRLRADRRSTAARGWARSVLAEFSAVIRTRHAGPTLLGFGTMVRHCVVVTARGCTGRVIFRSRFN